MRHPVTSARVLSIGLLPRTSGGRSPYSDLADLLLPPLGNSDPKLPRTSMQVRRCFRGSMGRMGRNPQKLRVTSLSRTQLLPKRYL